jgi:hypothetical protein
MKNEMGVSYNTRGRYEEYLQNVCGIKIPASDPSVGVWLNNEEWDERGM